MNRNKITKNICSLRISVLAVFRLAIPTILRTREFGVVLGSITVHLQELVLYRS